MSATAKTVKKVDESSMEMDDEASSKAYELMVIIDGTLRESESKKEIENIEKWIDKNKGKVTVSDVWGKKKLAYPIRHQEEAYYAVFNFELNPERAPAMDKMLRLEKEIMRSLTLNLPKNYKYVSFKDMKEKERVAAEERPEDKVSQVVVEKKSKTEPVKPSYNVEKKEVKEEVKEKEAPAEAKKEVDKDLDAKLDKILGGDLNF